MNIENFNQGKELESAAFQIVAKGIVENSCLDIDLNKISSETEIRTLGCDLLGFANFLVQLEVILLVDLDEILDRVDVTQFRTVGDIVNFVKKISKD